jgi:hypothetical protein
LNYERELLEDRREENNDGLNERIKVAIIGFTKRQHDHRPQV